MREQGRFPRAIPMDCCGILLDISPRHVSMMLPVAADAEIFRGHYPHFPIFPGIYLIETALQTIEHFIQEEGFTSARITTLKSARLLAPVRPGEELISEATLLEDFFSPQASSWEVLCRSGDTPAAKIKMVVQAQ